MKKFLLFAFALASVVASNAQGLSPKDAVAHRNDMENMPKQKMERAVDARRVGPKRTVENGMYYTIPGALYGGWTVDGRGYYYSIALVPPFADVTYANQMTDKLGSTWAINETDITEYAEENGDYVSNFSPNGWYYTPILGHKKIPTTYQFNEDNYWVQTGSKETNDNSLAVTYSPDLLMTPVDNHGTRYYNGTAYRNVLSGYGFLSSAFLFGTGSLETEEGVINAYGFEQSFNPLLAPMYLDAIHLDAVTYNEYGPIPPGGSVKAYIYALDEEGRAVETIATFEATSKDTLDFKDNDEYNGKTGYYGTLVYQNSEKFTDIFGNQTSLPAAIPAGVPFRIQFEGMNDKGVSIGAYALYKSEVEDTYIDNGYLLFDSGVAYTFQNPLCVNVNLLGQYEVIKVEEKDFLNSEFAEDFPAENFKGWNVLRVSADGQNISTVGLEGNENYDMGFAFVGTSVDWFDEDGLPNYDIDEDEIPDWIEGIEVDTTLYNGDNLTGYNLVFPICKPLPEGVSGRTCEINIYGNAGIAGDKKIIIIQGDGDVPGGTTVTMGDVNGDNKINGSDIVELVDRIMGRPSSKFVEAAGDLTGDGKINGSDLTELISLVMSQTVTPMPKFIRGMKEGRTSENHFVRPYNGQKTSNLNVKLAKKAFSPSTIK